MKKFFLVFLYCLVIPIVCQAQNKSNSKSNECCSIAYIDLDTLHKKYNRVIDYLNEKERKHKEDSMTFVIQNESLEKTLKEFQQKLENNLFPSAEAAETEHNRIVKINNDLETLRKNMMQRQEERDASEKQNIENLIKKATEKYNQTAKFQFILTQNGMDNILVANPEYNITEDILLILNSEYAESKDNNQ